MDNSREPSIMDPFSEMVDLAIFHLRKDATDKKLPKGFEKLGFKIAALDETSLIVTVAHPSSPVMEKFVKLVRESKTFNTRSSHLRPSHSGRKIDRSTSSDALNSKEEGENGAFSVLFDIEGGDGMKNVLESTATSSTHAIEVAESDKINPSLQISSSANIGRPGTSSDSYDPLSSYTGPADRRDIHATQIIFEKDFQGLTFQVQNADITSLSSDVIVCPANRVLDLSIGIPRAVSDLAGTALKDTCIKFISKYGSLATTDVLITPAGHLQAEKVFHAVSPCPGSTNFAKDLRRAVLNCLMLAELRGSKSIVFPLIGASTSAEDECFTHSISSVQCLVSFCVHRKAVQNLKKITFVDKRSSVAKRFVKFLKENWNNLSISCRSSTPDERNSQNDFLEEINTAFRICSQKTSTGFDGAFPNSVIKNKDSRQSQRAREPRTVECPICYAHPAEDVLPCCNQRICKHCKTKSQVCPYCRKNFWEMRAAREPRTVECPICYSHPADNVLACCNQRICQSCKTKIQVCPYCMTNLLEMGGTREPRSVDCFMCCAHLADDVLPCCNERICQSCKTNVQVCPNCRTNLLAMRGAEGPITIDYLECPVCYVNVVHVDGALPCCNNWLCRPCKTKLPSCPYCRKAFGIMKGNQPDGTMTFETSLTDVPGNKGCGSYIITYDFSDGIQSKDHLNPGQKYYGTSRKAYLPWTKEAEPFISRLMLAFLRRLTFTVGTSLTTGRPNSIVWNGIHHKTNVKADGGSYGYPDSGYFSRLDDDLRERGLTEDSMTREESTAIRKYMKQLKKKQCVHLP